MCLRALPGGVHAEGINTEHLFGFMIGTDIGDVGELPEPDYRAICQEWRKQRAIGQEFELEFVPWNHLERHANRIDETTAAVVWSYGIELRWRSTGR